MELDTATRQEIESLLRDHQVVLFMKGNPDQPQCGFSAKVVSALNMLVPNYATVDVLQNPGIREGIKAYANWPTIPQLYINGELIGGCDIVMEMFSAGELSSALGLESPASPEPVIDVTEPVVEAMRNATQDNPTLAVHLQIDAGWQHRLSLSPAAGDEIKITVEGIDILLDPWSAARANGLRIELEETLTGTRFRFDNPNAPSAA